MPTGRGQSDNNKPRKKRDSLKNAIIAIMGTVILVIALFAAVGWISDAMGEKRSDLREEGATLVLQILGQSVQQHGYATLTTGNRTIVCTEQRQ